MVRQAHVRGQLLPATVPAAVTFATSRLNASCLPSPRVCVRSLCLQSMAAAAAASKDPDILRAAAGGLQSSAANLADLGLQVRFWPAGMCWALPGGWACWVSSVEGVSRRSLLPCSSPDCPQPFLPCCPAPLVFRRRTTAVRTTMRMCLWRTFERALTALLPASTCALVKATTPQHKHSTTAMSPLRQRPRSPPLPLSFAARPCSGAARKEFHNTNKVFFATHPSARPRPTLPGSRPSRAASVCCRPLTRSHLSDTLLPSDLALHALFSPPAPLELPAPGSAQCGRPLSALQAPAPSPRLLQPTRALRAQCGPAGPAGSFSC